MAGIKSTEFPSRTRGQIVTARDEVVMNVNDATARAIMDEIPGISQRQISVLPGQSIDLTEADHHGVFFNVDNSASDITFTLPALESVPGFGLFCHGVVSGSAFDVIVTAASLSELRGRSIVPLVAIEAAPVFLGATKAQAQEAYFAIYRRLNRWVVYCTTGLRAATGDNNSIPTGAIGDMLTSIYDPGNVEGDAFNRANHSGEIPTDGIEDDAVTLAKLGALAANQVFGTDASGDPIALVAGTNVTISSGQINSSVPGGTGDMTAAVYDPTTVEADVFDRANHTGTQTLATISDAGTAAAVDVPSSGDAATDEAVLGDDTRLTDNRAPTAHTHTVSEVTDAGTAATRNVSGGGDAGATEVVLGNDTRLTDARTPTTHSHAISDVTNLQSELDGKASTGSVAAKADLTRTINTQAGASYTLVIGDAGDVIRMTSGSANTVTIPTNASVAYAVGTQIEVLQAGAGVTTIEGDTGVTVNGVSAGAGDMTAQFQGVALLKTATDAWDAIGGIGTVA